MEASSPMDISKVSSSLGTISGVAYNYRAMASDIDLRRGGFDAGYTLVLKVSSTSSLSNVGMIAVFLKDHGDSYYTPVNFQAATVQADGDYYIITSTINKYYDYTSTYPGFAIYTTEPVEIIGLEVVSYINRSGYELPNTIVFNYPTLAVQLSAPTNLHATNITSASAQLHWNSVENAEDYKVEYRQYGQTNWIEHQS